MILKPTSMRRRNERRFKSVLGLWLLTFGLLVSPLVHILVEHGHSHAHGAASHSHGLPLAPAHEHAPWSVEHLLALFVVGVAVWALGVASRWVQRFAESMGDPLANRVAFSPAMPQGP